MTGKDLLLALDQVERKYIQEAEFEIPGKVVQGKFEKRAAGKRPIRKILLIAAIVTLTALLTGCVAVYFLSAKDLRMGQWHHPSMGYLSEEGEYVQPPEVVRQVMSLQGPEGSPSYEGAKAWYDFTQSYDMNGVRLDTVEDVLSEGPEAYASYRIYSREMKEKLDSIAETYDLKLLGPAAPFQTKENDLFFDSLGIDSLLLPGTKTTANYMSGYFYQGGNFKIEFWLNLAGEGTSYHAPLLSSMYFSGKDYLDPVYLTVNGLDECEQWNYTTSDGCDVLILRGNDWARIFCDRPDAFVSVGTDCPKNMPNRDLEWIAESIDWKVQPKSADMEAVQEKLDQFREAVLATVPEEENIDELYRLPSFEDYIAFRLGAGANEDYPVEAYAMYDVDGDGQEELLLGAGDRIFDIVQMKDGRTFTMYFPMPGRVMYLCEDQVVCLQEEGPNGEIYYNFFHKVYYRGQPDQKVFAELCYSTNEEPRWTVSEFDTGVWKKPITEDEFNEALESYGRTQVDMKPISELSMD